LGKNFQKKYGSLLTDTIYMIYFTKRKIHYRSFYYSNKYFAWQLNNGDTVKSPEQSKQQMISSQYRFHFDLDKLFKERNLDDYFS